MTLLYYDCLAEFKRQFYKDLLTTEHLKTGQIKFDTLHFPDGDIDDNVNFWGYILEKDNIKYLLSSITTDKAELPPKEILPLRPIETTKVAHKGIVYHWIKKFSTAKYKEEKQTSFKQLIDNLSSFEHTNPTHQKLLWFMTLTQIMDRANFRVSTPPGFGKDSTVDILGNLIGGTGTIENPTIAKLEERASVLKLLAINEVVDVARSDWRLIEQFLLQTGAFKPEVTKRSRKYGALGEIINISNFSISLLYNDINCYPKGTKYFDEVTKDAVKDRFPALRLYGKYTEDFNKIKFLDVKKYVTENFEKYKKFIYTLMYYKVNVNKELHKWDSKLLINTPERWKTNLGRLLKIVDLYCDSQEEFNKWINVINVALKDYEQMLLYPELLEKTSKKLSNKEYTKLFGELNKIDSFIDKNKKLNQLLNGSTTTNYIVSGSNKDFWSK